MRSQFQLESTTMTLLTAGITKDVIRDIMPPYNLDPPAGLEPVRLLTAGIAATGRVPEGFVPAALDPAGLDPLGTRPGSESAPQATLASDPTVRSVAGLPGGSAAPMDDGRME